MTTDAAGTATARIDTTQAAQPQPSLLFGSDTNLGIVARWVGPTRATTTTRLTVPSSGAQLAVLFSLPQPVTPGIDFAITPVVAPLAGREPAAVPQELRGMTADVMSIELTAELCTQLAFCDAALIGNDPSAFRRFFDAFDVQYRVQLNATEVELLVPQSAPICGGYLTDSFDWQACRFALPDIGVHLIIACTSDDACFTATACAPSLRCTRGC